ncbi:cytochrome P450 [Fomes fomentarius]|nr:cytochrome P450 [Fomes fomentarius]
MEDMGCVLAVSGLLLIFLFALSRRLGHRAGTRLPPGPPGLPLVGNVRDIPPLDEYPFAKYKELCRKYNTDILRLNALGLNIIVLDTLEAATELLDRRSSIYSGRPRMVMLNELAGFGWNFASMDYGEDWRVCRKMARLDFHSASFAKYRPTLRNHVHQFVRRLAEEHGARLPVHLKHLIGANIMDVIYGIKVLPEHDPFIELAEAGQECLRECAVAGLYLVDIAPILKHIPAWLPGAAFQRVTRAWHKKATLQLHMPYMNFMKRLNSGNADDCMAKTLVEEFGDEGSEQVERHIKMTTATMYLAGAETTAAALHTFILAMVLYPEVQERARRELEKVIGTHRLPTFNDFGAVPYVDALIKETLRWHPVIDLNPHHKLRMDDLYNGYFLEKDSLILVNIWSILHDEQVYPDALTFKPERFLKSEEGTLVLNPDILDPEDVAFGFGRRVCPGQHMVYGTMWIAIATMLACLEIGKAKDKFGKEIEVAEEFVSRFVT